MTAFQTREHIGDRALQHCGANRLDPVLGFRDTNSRNAAEVSACYDKIREAELEANTWTCAIRRSVLRAIDSDTMILSPGQWAETTTYFKGSIVSDQAGTLWISSIPNNLNNDPLLTDYWEPYFGPLTVSEYSSATSYYAGEIVYVAPGNGTSRTYLSLQNGNSDNPATATAWSSTSTYAKNQVVTRSSVAYMSLVDLNTGNDPSTAPIAWNSGTTYAAGNTAVGSDGVVYSSVGPGNIGNDPTADSLGVFWTNTGTLAPWTTTFTGGTGSLKWLQIGGTEFPMGVGLETPNIVYPLGSGPSSQDISRNMFKLPAGYMREAPQTPKGTVSWLGGPSGNVYTDWNFENGYIVTAESGPLLFRFVANLTDVRKMAPMFCEALAARIGLAVCETLTQSTGKLSTIAKEYQEWIDRARTRNAIEQGYDDQPDDDYVTVRY